MVLCILICHGFDIQQSTALLRGDRRRNSASSAGQHGLAYKANAPVVAAGTPFYGGVNSADWCNNFAYQIILAEFASDGATLNSFSFNNIVHNPSDLLSLTGRLPSDNPSFVIAITWNNPGNGAAAGPGFTLASGSLGTQWQWQEFAAQPTGYTSPQFPGSCPGRSGIFQLGFTGGVVAGATPVGAFIWNLHPALAPPTPTITGITPATGPTSGGTVVVITGTNLTGATGVTFCGTPALSIVVNSPTQITAVTPPQPEGVCPVGVLTPSGPASPEGLPPGPTIPIFTYLPLGGTALTERSFACNGCFETSSAYGDVLKSLALSMAGFVVPPGDCWRIYAGSYVPPEVTLADGDCRGSIKADFRLSARDTCNGVKGQYIPAFLPINPLGPLASSPASPAWKKTDFPPVQRAQYIAEDGGVILWKDIQLDFTISLWMAQRIARIVLERLRRQVTISLPAKLTGLAALAADTINFCMPAGTQSARRSPPSFRSRTPRCAWNRTPMACPHSAWT